MIHREYLLKISSVACFCKIDSFIIPSYLNKWIKLTAGKLGSTSLLGYQKQWKCFQKMCVPKKVRELSESSLFEKRETIVSRS